MPRFSERTRFSTMLNRLSQAVEARRARGDPIWDLTETNPTRVGLGLSDTELRELLASVDCARYRPEPLGDPEARAAIAARCGAPLEHVVLTASSSESFSWLFHLLAESGDEILVPEPSYPLLPFVARLASVTLVPYPLSYDGEWHIDFETLRRRIGPRTRAVVTVSPGNPTGSFLHVGELSALGALCREQGLALIADEVFLDFPIDHRAAPMGVTGRSSAPLTIALGGLSKSFALPQLKLGWMTLSGDGPLVEEALERIETIGDTFLSVNTPAQRLVAPLFARRAAIQAPILERIRANDSWLRSRFTAASTWQPLKTKGGWTTLLRVPHSLTDEEWALRLLDETGTLLHPGYLYDFPGTARYLATSLILSPEVFREGTEQATRWIDRLTDRS